MLKRPELLGGLRGVFRKSLILPSHVSSIPNTTLLGFLTSGQRTFSSSTSSPSPSVRSRGSSSRNPPDASILSEKPHNSSFQHEQQQQNLIGGKSDVAGGVDVDTLGMKTVLARSLMDLANASPDAVATIPVPRGADVWSKLTQAPDWRKEEDGETKGNRIVKEHKSALTSLLQESSELTAQLNKQTETSKKVEAMPDYHSILPASKDMTIKELSEIDSSAVGVARGIALELAARQPYDTVAKVMKERLSDLPTDMNEFFAALGNSRQKGSSAFMKYLKVVSVKGTLGNAVGAMTEVKRKGIPITLPLITAYISACTRSCPASELPLVMEELSRNVPDIARVSVYPAEAPPDMEFYKDAKVQPPSKETPNGAPAGFVSVAPRFLGYGARRTAFNPSVELAFKAFEEARALGLEPDLQVYSSLIRVCAEHRHMERAFAVYALMRSKGIKPDHIIATHLMMACWKANRFEQAEETMHALWTYEGVQPDAPMYNLMIRICAETGNVEKAFFFYEQLQHFGFSPSLLTFTSLMHACVQRYRPEFYAKAFEVFALCTLQGFHPNTHMFNTLLYAAVERGDLSNGLKVWRTLCTTHTYARDSGSFEIFLRLIARTMNMDDRPGFGAGAVVDEESLTREARIRLAETVYGELCASKTKPSPMVFAELIGVYAQAAVGLMRYGRSLTERGIHNKDTAITNEVRVQLIKRTWDRIADLKNAHPDTFVMCEHGYSYVFMMYGAADRLDDAFEHLSHMRTQVGIKPTQKTYNTFLTWARLNRDLDAGLRAIAQMKEDKMPVQSSDDQFFKHKERTYRDSYKVQVPSFPPTYRDDDADHKFQNTPRRDKSRKGEKKMHPQDWNASYKDY